ncbi:anti-sigma factor family protein [Paenibacillus paeoniae]|uniref:Zf-HC2 domain-containing protein n=1 Tax=Paenibacillus paeoniae TaxID=2292705 RepID=A0A371PM37_9BACL|nr:zf-HC2 domain-containing protein [Paenibacillus paeoniae]REK77238.1 zf-HC2 domain-containing protein [Paenibacillus paeoniae]
MMKCEDVQLRFPDYWDMSEDDQERIELEAHLLDCEQCSAQYGFWDESENLVRLCAEETVETDPSEHVNRAVMERIYLDESWYLPVPSKSYHFSKSFRRNTALLIAGCMAMFACAFFVFVFDYREAPTGAEVQKMTGLIEAANASTDNAFLTAGFYAEVPVASISDPIVLKVVPTFPQYYVALSLLGLVMALLILNWLSRTRH